MTINYKPFTFKDFYTLDESIDQQYLVDSMDRMFEIEEIKRIKERATRLLNLQAGDSIIEVGCGLGHDAENFGKILKDSGTVIAIDSSKSMLEEAKKRSTHTQVQYLHGNGEKLDYPDNSFSAAYADRLFVSQKDIEKTFGELVRVVKKGGKVCVTDIDTGSAIMYPYVEKLTDMLLKRLTDIIRNPFIGRQLQSLFKKFGLTNIKIFSDAYVIKSFDLVNTMIDFPRMIKDLHFLHQITKYEAQKLLDALLEAEKNGDFLYSIILFTAIGEKA